MGKMGVCLVSALIATVFGLSGCSQETPLPSEKKLSDKSPPVSASGEELFKRYCSSCHPNGGNVTDPQRTLFSSTLKRNHITTPDDVVRVMRHPISRMIRFDEGTLSNQDARAIAEYVLTSYK
jgi:cytochrome c6